MGKAPGTSANDLIGKLKKDLGDIAAEARNARLHLTVVGSSPQKSNTQPTN